MWSFHSSLLALNCKVVSNVWDDGLKIDPVRTFREYQINLNKAKMGSSQKLFMHFFNFSNSQKATNLCYNANWSSAKEFCLTYNINTHYLKSLHNYICVCFRKCITLRKQHALVPVSLWPLNSIHESFKPFPSSDDAFDQTDTAPCHVFSANTLCCTACLKLLSGHQEECRVQLQVFAALTDKVF